MLDLRRPADQLRGWLAQLEDEGADRQRQAEIGQILFRALFHEAIRDLYMKAVGRSRTGLRLRLWFDAPELQALPWELLHDAVHGEFLGLSERVLVTRYLPVPLGEPPLTVAPPLRVLVATASPHGHPALDVEAEADAVQEALAPLATTGQAQVKVLHHAQVTTLRSTLREYNPHVLHFSGHGAVGPDGGALLLEDEAGDARLVGADDLSMLLRARNVRLAVLNACLTARGEPVEAAAFYAQRRALLGVGPALVRAGLGAVVAMQFSLSDASARLFARDFYYTVAFLEPVDLAVSRAREALALGAGTDSRDWATPVLFLRARDGVIFARSRQY
jgi:CHAT domain-containing protein